MATATAKSTLGNIFGMVGTTATAVTDLMGAASVGVTMLDRFAHKHADNQRTQYDLEAGGFKVQLVKTMAMEAARQNEEVVRFCGESDMNQQGYDEALKFYQALLAESEAKRTRAG